MNHIDLFGEFTKLATDLEAIAQRAHTLHDEVIDNTAISYPWFGNAINDLHIAVECAESMARALELNRDLTPDEVRAMHPPGRRSERFPRPIRYG